MMKLKRKIQSLLPASLLSSALKALGNKIHCITNLFMNCILTKPVCVLYEGQAGHLRSLMSVIVVRNIDIILAVIAAS